MPVYEYLCSACGPFTAVRPMREFDLPQECEECGEAAPRAMLTAPAMFGGDPGHRRAAAVNERSANEPKQGRRHPASCGCCSAGARKTLKAEAVPAAKSFPAQRPWMIGH
jgi:putative FmdB family regulatory protein